MEKYKTCQICGHKYPLGHPCMTCKSKKIEGEPITPEQITEYVKVLRVQKGDVIVIKSDMPPEDIGMIFERLEAVEELKGTTLLWLDKESEIIVVRRDDEQKL